ncbi:hypothetical protein O1611_g9252 [Lasiodiplodia mahajangana]|uniref:Uncharacterized protein n=1 Tax=Lasiodiplodia mahajangana TaxID=1108764 RepID=A0ACC2JA45_9PEZI|nr:hypothetical protein O1611_g9252 [Lasiodiplodia mahajangana]
MNSETATLSSESAVNVDHVVIRVEKSELVQTISHSWNAQFVAWGQSGDRGIPYYVESGFPQYLLSQTKEFERVTMAPKRGLQQQQRRPDLSKRPRLDAHARMAIATPRRTAPRIEVYSPNIDTSEFSELTEDDEEPRNTALARMDGTVDVLEDEDLEGDPPLSASIPYGKSGREMRARRRAAEKQGEDFTEDEEEEQARVVDAKTEIEEPDKEEALWARMRMLKVR